MARKSTLSHRKVRQLLHLLEEKEPVLIVTHDNPDPDALGASVGLRYLIEHYTGRKPTVAFGGTIGRAENKAMVEILGLGVVPVRDVDPVTYGAVVLVDTQPGAGNHSLPIGLHPIAVIDHHPRPSSARPRKVPFSDVRPRYGATSTIVAEYIDRCQVTPPAAVATALFYGIKSDTQSLGRKVSSADIDAYLRLFPIVDKRALARIEHPRLPRSYFAMFRTALDRAAIYGPVVVSALGEMEHPGAAAEIADFLMRLEGAVWAVCLGAYDGQVFVSVRTSDPEANAGAVVRQALGDLGTCGGHGMMAAGRVPQPDGSRIQRQLETELVRRFLVALGASEHDAEPLVVRRAAPLLSTTRVASHAGS
ncbi:MAG TPA: bifunctional oligoribonuclease/PAP phosphatase NrnA [Chloroflexota bacterium]